LQTTFSIFSLLLFSSCIPKQLFPTDDLDSIENVAKLKTPLLLVTGDSDWIVSYKN